MKLAGDPRPRRRSLAGRLGARLLEYGSTGSSSCCQAPVGITLICQDCGDMCENAVHGLPEYVEAPA